MNKIIYILLFLVLFETIDAKFGWYPLKPNTNKFIYGVCFVDSLYGWAVGDEGLIINTKDGGKSWSVQSENVGSWLLSVHFIDRFRGWTVGDFGRIRNTTNGGLTWDIQQSITYPELLNSVYFVDKNHGWATGVNGIIHTSDGGENWLYQTSDTITASKSIFFINSFVGWACGANGTIVKTADGGESWFKQNTGTNSAIYDVFFLDENNGWAVCRYEPKILRTTNGGNNWVPNENSIPGFYKKIQFVDKNNGWAVGLGGIVKSSDGGKNWKIQIPDSRYNLWWASFIDDKKGWAVGGDGTLLKTDNGGYKFNVDFSSNAISGEAPLSTTFTDLSEGEHTEWKWDFGDGGTHTTQNPIYIYQEPGQYAVQLTISDGIDSDSKTKFNYINVINPNALIADFSADTTFGTIPLTVKFKDLSTGEPLNWNWDFGDGGTHKTQNPLHVYQESGSFTVSLKITKGIEEATETKKDFIIVKEPIHITDELKNKISVNAVPNPSNSIIQIDISGIQNIEYSLAIVDQKGTTVKDFGKNTIRNKSVFRWDFTDENNNKISEGIYYLILHSEKKQSTITKKIIYMR